MQKLQRVVLAFVAALTVAPCLDAGVDLTFEPWDDNTLEHPHFSGTTASVSGGLSEDTTASDPTDTNDRLNAEDGTPGTHSYVTVFQFLDDEPGTGGLEDDGPFVRITDLPDRHLLSEPSIQGGIGVYLKNTGEGGSVEVSLAIREEPRNEGDNELYENTVWRVIGPSRHWQYLYWSFETGMATGAPDAWGIVVGLGDGVYDGGGADDATVFEALLIRPIPGVTVPNEDIIIRIDDIHTGPPHSPLDPVEALGFTLR